jgi:multiple sugar transport system ATP-binding protein
MNFFEGTIVRHNGEVVFHAGFEAPVDAVRAPSLQQGVKRRVILGLRPEHIAEAESQGAPALVERVEAIGLENIIYCSCNGTPLVSRLPAARTARRGDRLMLRFDMERAHFFDAETGAALAG